MGVGALRVRVQPVYPDTVELKVPASPWSVLVSAAALAAAGGGVVKNVNRYAARLSALVLSKLGYDVRIANDELSIEPVEERSADHVTVNVGCSYDVAVFTGVVAGAIAEPGSRIALRGCEELVEADWRPLLESVSVYGGRAWATGNPRSLVIVEAVGRGRLRAGLWRVRATEATSAHIAGLIVAALAAPDKVYIRVWPRDPSSKTDIDHAVYAASLLGRVNANSLYNRFEVEPAAGKGRVSARSDTPLALHLAGLAATGSTVVLRLEGDVGETPYSPLRVASIILDSVGYRHSIDENGVLRVDGIDEYQPVSRIQMYDFPDFAAAVLTLVASRRGEMRVEELPAGYTSDVEELIGLLAGLGYRVEFGGGTASVSPGEPVAGLAEQVAVCTTPHILVAAVPLAHAAKTPIIIERGDCLKNQWPEFYQALGEAGVLREEQMG